MHKNLVVPRQWHSSDGRKGTRLYLWCPGCDDLHAIEIQDEGARWTWDGSTEMPTISPSILVNGVQWAEGEHFHKPNHNVKAGDQITCHSFVQQGRWQFLGDCTHNLVGQTVSMVPLPDWVTEEAIAANRTGGEGVKAE